MSIRAKTVLALCLTLCLMMALALLAPRITMLRRLALTEEQLLHADLLLALGLIMVLLVIVLFDRLVLARVSALSRALDAIGASGDASARVPVDGRDALGRVGAAINRMLEALGQTRRAELEQHVLRESEARYRQLVEFSPDAVMIFSHEHCAFANGAAVALFGAGNAGALLGQPLEALFPPTALASLHRDMSEGVWDLPSLRMRHQLARCDGATVTVELTAVPITYQQAPAMQVVAHDATLRLQTENALAAERASLSAAVGILPMPILFLDARHRVTRANLAAGAAGVTAANFAELRFLLPDERDPMSWQAWSARCRPRDEVVAARELDLLLPDGKRLSVLLHVAPIIVDDEAISTVVAFQDITPLKELDHAKNEMLAVVSHELLTPLTSILGWSELAASTGTPELMAQALDVVQRNAQRQRRLVNTLLDTSRIIHGKLPFSPAPVDLCHLVRQTVATTEHTAREWGVDVETAVPDCPVWVQADPARLHQVLDHLVTNGLKFTPAGGRVAVSVAPRNGMAVLTVADSGRGFTAEGLATIFRPFLQIDRDEAKGGLGLGLALSRGIMELHGGRIIADSSGPGQGSTFTVEMPLLAPDAGALEASVAGAAR